MRAMRTLVVLLVALAGCSNDRASATEAEPAKAEPPKAAPAKAEPVKAEPAAPDPVALRICEAFVDVHGHNKTAGDDKILQRTAARALQLGVNEGQIDAFGPTPAQMLASIRARGNPPECAALVDYLESRQ
jgi:hypothetical protein